MARRSKSAKGKRTERTMRRRTKREEKWASRLEFAVKPGRGRLFGAAKVAQCVLTAESSNIFNGTLRLQG